MKTTTKRFPFKSFSLPPCFSRVWKRWRWENRFNGFTHARQTVETVSNAHRLRHTQLKQGVNEIRIGSSIGSFNKIAPDSSAKNFGWRRFGFLTLAFLILFSHRCFAAEPAVTNRFENEIRVFAASDKTNPPPKNAILFLGSSSIRLWKDVARDFPEFKVINRGFGGSEVSDSVYFFDRIVKPYRPKQIVMYAGGNDINSGKTPEEVFRAFTNFVAMTHRELPQTRLAYISIAPNPARWSQVERVKTTNRLIEDFTKKDSQLAFINVFPAMLGDDGQPKPDIFRDDKLHMNAKGYAIWAPIVRPFLIEDRTVK